MIAADLGSLAESIVAVRLHDMERTAFDNWMSYTICGGLIEAKDFREYGRLMITHHKEFHLR